MAKLTKQTKEFMWSKIQNRINEVINPMTEQVKAEEQHISDTLAMAKEKPMNCSNPFRKLNFPSRGRNWKRAVPPTVIPVCPISTRTTPT